MKPPGSIPADDAAAALPLLAVAVRNARAAIDAGNLSAAAEFLAPHLTTQNPSTNLTGVRDAIAAQQVLIAALEKQNQTEAAVTARMMLARVWHAHGVCGEAVRHGEHAWRAWRHLHGTTEAGGLQIAVPLLAMLAACGRTIEALRVLGQASPALPPPGDPARDRTTAWAAELIDTTTRTHSVHCAVQLDAEHGINTRIDIARAVHFPPSIPWKDFLT